MDGIAHLDRQDDLRALESHLLELENSRERLLSRVDPLRRRMMTNERQIEEVRRKIAKARMRKPDGTLDWKFLLAGADDASGGEIVEECLNALGVVTAGTWEDTGQALIALPMRRADESSAAARLAAAVEELRHHLARHEDGRVWFGTLAGRRFAVEVILKVADDGSAVVDDGFEERSYPDALSAVRSLAEKQGG
jgi:hypothetical protein